MGAHGISARTGNSNRIKLMVTLEILRRPLGLLLFNLINAIRQRYEVKMWDKNKKKYH